jgi:hypothetical protein
MAGLAGIEQGIFDHGPEIPCLWGFISAMAGLRRPDTCGIH